MTNSCVSHGCWNRIVKERVLHFEFLEIFAADVLCVNHDSVFSEIFSSTAPFVGTTKMDTTSAWTSSAEDPSLGTAAAAATGGTSKEVIAVHTQEDNEMDR